MQHLSPNDLVRYVTPPLKGLYKASLRPGRVYKIVKTFSGGGHGKHRWFELGSNHRTPAHIVRSDHLILAASPKRSGGVRNRAGRPAKPPEQASRRLHGV